MAEFPTFKGSWPWPWIDHTAYRHASLIDLYIQNKFHWNRRNTLWMDGRTDWHLRPTLLGRLGGVDLKSTKDTTDKGKDKGSLMVKRTADDEAVLQVGTHNQLFLLIISSPSSTSTSSQIHARRQQCVYYHNSGTALHQHQASCISHSVRRTGRRLLHLNLVLIHLLST